MVSLAADTNTVREDHADTPVPFASFCIGDRYFEIAEERSEGTIFLLGPIPPDATHVVFGLHSFELSRLDAEDTVEVSGLGLIEAEQYLDLYGSGPGDLTIYFVTR